MYHFRFPRIGVACHLVTDIQDCHDPSLSPKKQNRSEIVTETHERHVSFNFFLSEIPFDKLDRSHGNPPPLDFGILNCWKETLSSDVGVTMADPVVFG